MIEIKKEIAEVREQVKTWKREGLSVGFVPTMGYLHEGHISLVETAVRENDKVVVSIFVNPIQFGPSEDLESYPRDLLRDSQMCEQAGAELIFHPEAEEMYPQDFLTYVDMEGVTEQLCGKSRPGHFRGVCTVVNKLFQIVQPDRAYFGQKDAQQLAVIKRMVRDLNMELEVIGCPIVREKDGLAMSSRNTYLSEEERAAALVLSQTIRYCETMIAEGERDTAVITAKMKKKLAAEPLARIDYVEIVDSLSMKKITKAEGEILAAIAVFIGKTRLIDNTMLTV